MAAIRLASAARYTVHPPLSHQLAAWNWLEGELSPHQLGEFADLFRADPPAKPSPPVGGMLRVPYYSQLDNASGQGWRECFSSACAMLAGYYGRVMTDDEYNRIRSRFGDTTSASAQVNALRQLGLDARFIQNGTPELLRAELQAGRPVSVGWLHRGPVGAPAGGGHWSTVIGISGDRWVHHDPYGEADLVRGGYVNHTNGRGIRYSFGNWNPRWMPEGNGSGWAVLARPQ
jgi:hypothetical protein